MRAMALVFLGAGLGGGARFWLSQWILTWAGRSFPWHTMTINVTGSLLIGILMGLVGPHAVTPNEDARLLFVVGLLGGYTTFSSFSYETAILLRERNYLPAIGYASGSVLMGLGATWLGILAVGLFRR